MIARRRKSTVDVYLIMSAERLGVPVAAIGKVRVPSVSGGYGAADTFSPIRLMLFDRGHAKDVRSCAFA